MDDAFCDAAEEAFEQFGDVMGTFVEVMEDASIANNELMRDLAQLYALPGTPDDRTEQDAAEEERCLRQSMRCYLVDVMLCSGSVASWESRADVTKVVYHRSEDRYTVFARMYPRLSRGEVKRLQRDIKTFLPEGADVRIIAVWSRKKG